MAGYTLSVSYATVAAPETPRVSENELLKLHVLARTNFWLHVVTIMNIFFLVLNKSISIQIVLSRTVFVPLTFSLLL